MIKHGFFVWLMLLGLVTTSLFVAAKQKNKNDSSIVSYVINTRKDSICMYWKDEKGENYGSIKKLQVGLKNNHKELVFAMNAGMYKPDHSPVGLYIENGKILSAIDTSYGVGNFYLKPNGVFCIRKNNTAVICKTAEFKTDGNIKFATQSGPMLLTDGNIHPTFSKGSTNKRVRNGVGILPDGKIVFSLSKVPVSFYDFADYFKKLGCRNALYLDGFVSRMYLPEKNWIQTDGDFGVIIGITTYTE